MALQVARLLLKYCLFLVCVLILFLLGSWPCIRFVEVFGFQLSCDEFCEEYYRALKFTCYWLLPKLVRYIMVVILYYAGGVL